MGRCKGKRTRGNGARTMKEKGELKPYYEDKWECKHCGKCCLAIPCVFAQVKYGITSSNGKRCPDLIERDTGYYCLLIERDVEVRDLLLDGQCDDPSLTKGTVDASVIVREYFPDASDDEVGFILWNHTGYPEFWNIPEDGWTSSQCLRKQLNEFKHSKII